MNKTYFAPKQLYTGRCFNGVFVIIDNKTGKTIIEKYSKNEKLIERFCKYCFHVLIKQYKIDNSIAVKSLIETLIFEYETNKNEVSENNLKTILLLLKKMNSADKRRYSVYETIDRIVDTGIILEKDFQLK